MSGMAWWNRTLERQMANSNYVASPTKTTLGPRGRGMGALGATPSPVEAKILQLQAQINRFISPPLAMTGVLDPATAMAAQSLIATRLARSFVEDPTNKETARLWIEATKNVGTALPWVAMRLVEITDTLRDYGDFIGKPPARGGTSKAGKAMLIVAAAAVAAIFLTSRRGGKGRRR
jgi:hypothetical protein